jgi:hypothetical protein
MAVAAARVAYERAVEATRAVEEREHARQLTLARSMSVQSWKPGSVRAGADGGAARASARRV